MAHRHPLPFPPVSRCYCCLLRPFFTCRQRCVVERRCWPVVVRADWSLPSMTSPLDSHRIDCFCCTIPSAGVALVGWAQEVDNTTPPSRCILPQLAEGASCGGRRHCLFVARWRGLKAATLIVWYASTRLLACARRTRRPPTNEKRVRPSPPAMHRPVVDDVAATTGPRGRALWLARVPRDSLAIAVTRCFRRLPISACQWYAQAGLVPPTVTRGCPSGAMLLCPRCQGLLLVLQVAHRLRFGLHSCSSPWPPPLG